MHIFTQQCDGCSFVFLNNFEAPETDRTTFTNGQRYGNNLPYVAAAPLYNPQYINLDTVAQSMGMLIMSLDVGNILLHKLYIIL